MKILALVLFLSLSQVQAAEVWFTSNVGTADMLDMFTQPQKWATARSKINIMKFYGGQLEDECPKWCNNNTFANFKARDAFQKLEEWGIDVAVEAGAVKPGACDADYTGDIMIRQFQNMKNNDVVIRHIAMDEPFVSGKEWCDQPEEDTARYTANWINRVRNAHKSIYGDNETLRIGLIEAYPHFNMDQIIGYMKLLKRYGANFDFIHIDPDWWAVKGKKLSDSRVRADYNKLKAYARSESLPIGMYFWGHAGSPRVDHAKYERDVMELVKRTKKWYGTVPDHVQFQSWEETEGEQKVVPNNLPETWKLSHMSILLRGLQMLGVK